MATTSSPSSSSSSSSFSVQQCVLPPSKFHSLPTLFAASSSSCHFQHHFASKSCPLLKNSTEWQIAEKKLASTENAIANNNKSTDEQQQQQSAGCSTSTESALTSSSSSSSSSQQPSSSFFLDNCTALLDQVPDSFDFGLRPVRLCMLAASPSNHYMAIGTRTGGALFLFNRRLGQSVKPLRTNYNETVTQLQFHSEGQRDQLAVGHQSGLLVLLALPTSEHPMMAQHVQEQAHRGTAVTALCWSRDGRTLFSGDQSGMVLANRVDFAAAGATNSEFSVHFVSAECTSVTALAVSGNHLAIASGNTCKLLMCIDDQCAEYELLAQMDLDAEQRSGKMERQVMCIAFIHGVEQRRLTLLRRDGQLFEWLQGMQSSSELVDIVANLSAEQTQQWMKEEEVKDAEQLSSFFGDGAGAVADPTGYMLVLWRAANMLLCRRIVDNGNHTGFGLEMVAMGQRVGQPDLQILSVCATDPSELFVLTDRPRCIFRIGRNSPAPPTLVHSNAATTTAEKKMPSKLFGSLLAAGRAVGDELQKASKRKAQRLLPTGTEEWMNRMNRELEVFLIGEDNGGGGGDNNGEQEDNNNKTSLGERLASGLWIGTEPERLARGFQQVMGQIRQSSSILSTEFDHWSMAGTAREWSRERGISSFAKMSLPTELSPSLDDGEREELISMLGDDRDTTIDDKSEVHVRRRRIVGKRRRRSAAAGNDGLRVLAEERQQQQRTSSALALMEEPTTPELPNLSEEQERRILLEVLGDQMSPEERMEILAQAKVEETNNVIEVQEMNMELDGNGEEPNATEQQQQQQRGFNDDDDSLIEEEKDVMEEAEKHEKIAIAKIDDGMNLFGIGIIQQQEEIDEDEYEEDEQWQQRQQQRPPPTLDLSKLLAHHPPSSPSSPPLALSSSSSSIAYSSSLPASPRSTYAAAITASENYQWICRQQQCANEWTRLDTPFVIGQFTASRHYLVACAKTTQKGSNSCCSSRAHFLMTGTLGIGTRKGTTSQLNALALKADAIVANASGTRLWRVRNGVGFAPANVPDPLCPSASLSRQTAAWCKMTSADEGKLLQVALTNSQHAWYLTEKGIFVQMFLPENGEIGIWYRAWEDEQQYVAGQFTQIAACDSAVWLLDGNGRVVVRTGLRQKHGPMGVDWADMQGQPRHKFVSIALWEHNGFGLDEHGTLWFVHGVSEQSPCGVGPWLKSSALEPIVHEHFPANASKLAQICDWRLQVGVAGIFVAVGPGLLHCAGPLVGSRFFEQHNVLSAANNKSALLNGKFVRLAAGAIAGCTANGADCLFALTSGADGTTPTKLLAYSLLARRFDVIAPPPSLLQSSLLGNTFCCSVVYLHIVSIGKWIFLLDCRDGCVHVRRISSIGSDNNWQKEWIRFGQPAAFCSIAVSASSIWAIAKKDSTIWACRFRPSNGLNRLDWCEIQQPANVMAKDAAKQCNGKPNQVRVSPTGQTVCMFCTCCGVSWMRTDLSSQNWRGKEWKRANDAVRVEDIALGDNGIWALEKGTRELHRYSYRRRREGGAHDDDIGCWRAVGFQLNAISVDAHEQRLWAVDMEGRIVRHELDIFSPDSSDRGGTIQLKCSNSGKNDVDGGKDPTMIGTAGCLNGSMGQSSTFSSPLSPSACKMLSKSREMPERSMSGGSVSSWLDIGGNQ